MSKRIKLALPVRVDEDNDLVDSEGYCVAYEGSVAPHSAVTSELALRVNYHERLIEALLEVLPDVAASELTGHGLRYDGLRLLLAELEATK